jgi:hypothetical protein
MTQPATQGNRQDASLLQELNLLPQSYKYVVSKRAERELRRIIELSICNHQEDICSQLFPSKSRKLL